MRVYDEKFDVVVIGAGHAGCEAASAAARIGVRTALVTINLDLIGQMSCNPAIGGIAKGHIVREIDALGGLMGRVIDRTGIQFRLLNRSRGPAVQSPRAQADRALYRTEMRTVLENTPNLFLRQGQVVDLFYDNLNVIEGLELQDTRRIAASKIIVATGTFLNGLIHTGNQRFSAGRAGEPASIELASRLKEIGFTIGRLKTGTPPRLDGRTIDWSAFEIQEPDEEPVAFSFSTEKVLQPQIDCYIGYTHNELHDNIRNNLDKSPLYSGVIKGIGPRYCPSIEDKVVKFAEKDRHQLFLEPEGLNTNEVYLNGFSTSLPAEMQQDLLRMISGFESVEIVRPGYAIEYDYADPREIRPTMETVKLNGLYFAGQINGTTGYEEAACQGLLAGINAALSVQNRGEFVLGRDESYIGVLADDLIRHGVDEPYRIFTSRAESRLLLRHDNADQRLTEKGRDIGLVGDGVWQMFQAKRDRISNLRRAMTEVRFKRSSPEYGAVSLLLGRDVGDSFSLSQMSMWQGVDAKLISDLLPTNVRSGLKFEEIRTVVSDFLYSGYFNVQKTAAERVNRYDSLKISALCDFRKIEGLSNEMIERVERVRPNSFAQVKTIPGLTPAAVSAILLHLLANERNVARTT